MREETGRKGRKLTGYSFKIHEYKKGGEEKMPPNLKAFLK